MLTKVYWNLGGKEFFVEEVERPEHWGKSIFWYCFQCGTPYSYMQVEKQPWQAVSGCCRRCEGNRWTIPDTLEALHTVGWNVPEQVVRWQLNRELAFLNSPQHPYNEKELTNV